MPAPAASYSLLLVTYQTRDGLARLIERACEGDSWRDAQSRCVAGFASRRLSFDTLVGRMLEVLSEEGILRRLPGEARWEVIRWPGLVDTKEHLRSLEARFPDCFLGEQRALMEALFPAQAADLLTWYLPG